MGAVSAQKKPLQGSEAEKRKLLGGTEENIVCGVIDFYREQTENN